MSPPGADQCSRSESAPSCFTPELLTAYETCRRKAFWLQNWESEKLRATEMDYRALGEALTEAERKDHGEVAGETVVGLSADRGIDTPHYYVYDIGVHHAALADILSVYLRPIGSKPWVSTKLYESCYCDGANLTRIILVDHISDDRVMAECRNWYTLAPMVTYELPMTLQFLVLGPSKTGKRVSAWTRGLLHPRNHSLKFARKSSHSNDGSLAKVMGFGANWVKAWREDHAEITRERWLEQMEVDGQFKELSVTRNVELPPPAKLNEIRRDMQRTSDALMEIKTLPPKVYSACHWPMPCPFLPCCWGDPERIPTPKTYHPRER